MGEKGSFTVLEWTIHCMSDDDSSSKKYKVGKWGGGSAGERTVVT